MHSRFVLSAVGSALVAGATLAGAQGTSAPDLRWQAWFGCWEPAMNAAVGVAPPSQLTCVYPSSASHTVEVATVSDGKIVQRQRLATTTGRLETNREGCKGWESAEWSRNSRRVYLRSEYTCPTGIKRTTDGLIALTPDGEWLDVEGFRIGERSGVRVMRYREAATPGILPLEISTALQGQSMAISTARSVLTGPLGTDEIIDASRHLDAPVVETWLTERHQGFALDADRLMTLADAGVPSSVTDVMVALTYPGVFAIQQRTADGGSTEFTHVVEDGVVGGDGFGPVVVAAPFDPFFGSYNSPWSYGGYGISPYGVGSGYGWYSGSRPVVVIPRGSTEDDTPAPQGRAVKGRGYTRGSSGSTGSGSTTSGGSSSSGKGGSASAGKSTGSSGSTRTAKPRKP